MMIEPSIVRCGTVKWRSRRYPNKRYVAHCFCSATWLSVFKLVMNIPDYHKVSIDLHLKH